MGDIKLKYGSSAVSISCTITSLANTGQRGSASVDNTANLFEDALVEVTVKSAAAATSATGIVNIYAYGTVDNGTTWGDTATGSDAGVTLTAPPNLKKIGTINVVANAVTYKSNPLSVAAAFNGILPQKWGIVVENLSGATLDASVGAAQYQGVLHQYT